MIPRREFVALVGGAAVWPLGARAQQIGNARRVGVLLPYVESDAEARRYIEAFEQSLETLGWTPGRNVLIDYRFSAGDVSRMRSLSVNLVAAAPDVIVTQGAPGVSSLQLATRTVPIVFVSVIDPVGEGIITSLARPGGNTTGFSAFEYGMSGKWLELLKEIAPRIVRAAVVRDPTLVAGGGQFGAIQAVASSFGVELSPIDAREPIEIESAITSFASKSNSGLIVLLSPGAVVHRELIIKLAAQYQSPAVYPYRYFVVDGGLVSYGPDPLDQYRRAAGYVNRILKGEKPADLPVQAPTKYELTINLKTAKALGLDVPPSLLARADELIE